MAKKPVAPPAPAPDAPLSAEKIATVKATIPALRSHGVEVVTRFYALLFERFPTVRKHFNMDRHAGGRTGAEGVPAQIASLARAVLLYAQNVDKAETLLPTVKAIAEKHVARGISPPQYDAVGGCLLDAMRDVLGAAATPAVIDAWTVAYGRLAAIFVSVETEVKATAAKRAGYDGFYTMPVTKVATVPDGKEIWVSEKVPGHSPGMFVAVGLDVGSDVGPTMLTGFIDTKSETELRIRVPSNGERANEFLIANADVGMKLDIGMPCGEPAK